MGGEGEEGCVVQREPGMEGSVLAVVTTPSARGQDTAAAAAVANHRLMGFACSGRLLG
jgi:hypothetical protein